MNENQMDERRWKDWQEAQAVRYSLDEPYRSRMRSLIHALESGEHAQGQSRLEITQADGTVKQCCLGVLCRVAMADGMEVYVEKMVILGEPDRQDWIRTSFGHHTGHPPSGVMNWLLPGNSDEERSAMLGSTWLIRMNDTMDYNFTQIAQFLRNRFELPKVASDD